MKNSYSGCMHFFKVRFNIWSYGPQFVFLLRSQKVMSATLNGADNSVYSLGGGDLIRTVSCLQRQ